MLHNNQVLTAMRDSDSSKPAIFAMSNPTNNGLSQCLSSIYTLQFSLDLRVLHLLGLEQLNALLLMLLSMLVEILCLVAGAPLTMLT